MKKVLLAFLGVILLALLAGAFQIWRTYGSINIPGKSDAPVVAGVFTIPAGFSSFTEFANDIPDARTLVMAPGGVLLVAQPKEGTISALPDSNGDGKAERAIVIDGLDRPHGMAFRCTKVETPDVCDFYVAEESMLSLFAYDAVTMKATKKKTLIELPSSGALGAHKTRSLIFLPSPNEDQLLISIGSTCNVCEEGDNRFASVLIYHIISGKVEHYATGLRNAVYMTLHPVTGEVWATEMGRDGLGDDIPPDEVNVVQAGEWYGWPWFYGKNIEDTKYSPNARPSFARVAKESHVDIPAHSAPLGIAFVPEEGWPEEYWFNALVAYHGSWNRSTPTGYKVVRMIFDNEGAYQGTEDFITGWLLSDGETIGRPADVLALSGGVLYVSDDQAGRVYRLSH